MQEDKWILCSDRLPPYDELVLVYRKLCNKCYEDPADILHGHKMVYQGEELETAFYHRKNVKLVEYCQTKDDHCWDSFANDYWSTHSVFAWMKLPKKPRLKEY